MTSPAESLVAITCSNSDCRIAETGRCVEGLEPSDCSHYGRQHEVANTLLGDLPEVIQKEESIQLPGAGTLTPADASQVLREGNTRVIAIVGPSDAGKTSLIASVYDLLQRGAVNGLDFAHSRTLHAFEQACHDARAASRRGTPHMSRTPLGEVRFYHLELGGQQLTDRVALVLGDRAGEEYRNAADEISTVDTFIEVKRADSLAVLIDGQRLLHDGRRHNVRSETCMMLQALVDGGAVASGLRLAIILTKQDLIIQSELRQRADDDFQRILARIQSSFGDVFSEIRYFPIAASPQTSVLARGAGVVELLSFWLESSQPAPVIVSEPPTIERAYARLTTLEE
ncbi:MAG: hypothetical protein C0422_12925 [Alcaligenaceae bacterium]|jgi:hypothetical protein|nr:hypothetical protein [Alcaligenaceae bacterium]